MPGSGLYGGVVMGTGSCDDVDYGDLFSIPNPAPPRMLSFSLQQAPLQFFPSIGFHGSPADLNPCPPRAMVGRTPSPVSTTTELENSGDQSEAVSDDAVLAYINQFLLEDDDEESCPGAAASSVEGSALLAVEKPFVDILTDANLTQAHRESSWKDGCCNVTGDGGLPDVFMGRQTSSQLVSCELVEGKEECTVHKGRRNRHDDGLELEEERRSKHTALCEEETVREMFDKVLLCNGKNCELQQPLPDEAQITGGYVKGSGNKRGRRKGKSGAVVEETVDLTTLLIHCAQAAAIDDHRNSSELLKQIRQHSSATGDASQRLAHYFADGLEARLAGTGSSIYRSLVAKRTSTADILHAFKLYVKACPFKKMSNFFSNQTILNASKDVKKLHIIDFGIRYGFQWPIFMQRISKRAGGPPSLRITGIDLPQPGFRPAERIEATGKRLQDYARMFNVPFEYHSIAAKWDTIRVEDLRIDKDELLVVNCLFRMRNVMDETVTDDSPRMRVLNTIRKMNPHLFVHGVVNGTYNAPFFVTRFKEAMFFFSSIFDMLEVNASRTDEQRLLIERDFFGREALNVVACEGTERVERPETYKQWQVRNLRAGFTQLPLNDETVKKARLKVSRSHHKDFLVDEDNKWMLQGWKGRIILAISTWKPT